MFTPEVIAYARDGRDDVVAAVHRDHIEPALQSGQLADVRCTLRTEYVRDGDGERWRVTEARCVPLVWHRPPVAYVLVREHPQRPGLVQCALVGHAGEFVLAFGYEASVCINVHPSQIVSEIARVVRELGAVSKRPSPCPCACMCCAFVCAHRCSSWKSGHDGE